MSVKLYPPVINGVLPAFYLEYDNSNKIKTGGKLTIPFSMNAAVSETQIKGFSLRLRTTASGAYVLPPIYSNVYTLNNGAVGEVTFQFSAAQARALTEGQYYKIQIAYCATQEKDEAGNVSGEDIGYYSTVGVAKCVSKPSVSIRNLTFENINAFNNEYLGFYDLSDCKDHTEKVYSYEFKIYDPQGNVFYTTGERLHQSSYDIDYTSSFDRITINDFASTEVIYTIEYTVTTLNGLIISSPKYRISNQYLVTPNGKITVIPKSDEEHGFIDVHLYGEIDPNHSYYYILDTELLNGLDVDENNNPLKDGSGFTIPTKTKNVLNQYTGYNEKLEFLSTHNLYKFYQYFSNKFFYQFLGSRMTSFVEINGKFYNKSDLQYYFDMNIDIPEEVLQTLDYYEKLVSGKNVLKSLSYQYIEDNFIDINQKTVIGTREHEKKYFGNYLLSRASDLDNYTTWFNIARFRMDDQVPSDFSIKDVTIEHGRKYKYAVQQYNIWGLYSAKMISNEFEASFEDIFLYDGERSLRVRYNPTVDTFKTTVLEQKTDTIGGKYPYITRNGATYYKEFPVGGLLAQEIDDMHYFIDPHWDHGHRHSTSANLKHDEDTDKYWVENEPDNLLQNAHDFSDTTIGLERNFKLNVLEWLNNGKPKLFKSPYEGNYIVRLMNVSLTPVKELGRMLHSFTSQAYEIAECTYDNLVAFGFIKTSIPSDLVGLWKTYDLRDPSLRASNGDVIISFEHGVQSFTIQDLMPGDIIYLQFSDQDEELPIMIGITGSYTYEGISNNLIKIRIPQPEDHELTGMLNCFYTGMRITDFDSIIDMKLKTIVSQQYVGTSPWMQMLKRINWEEKSINADVYSNIINDTQYDELQNYNFRTYLDRAVEKTGTSHYYPSESFAKLARSFDPGELLDRINLTINQGAKYKTELLNMEMIRFRQRPLIPVFTQSDYYSSFYTPGEYSTLLKPRTPQTQNVILCSTSPYGYPHPIEELAEYEMLDPFCIYQVFEYHSELDNWVPINGNNSSSFYDPYYRAWLVEDYDPTVKMNFNWKQVVLLESQIIGYCTQSQLDIFLTNNISSTGKYWSDSKETTFTLSETAISNLSPNKDETLGYIVPIYGYTEESQYLVERNRIHQANKIRKENGLYIDQAINEKEMFDYQLEKTWDEQAGTTTIHHYGYPTKKGFYDIKENKYDLFEKINNQYFAIGKENIIPNTVYWIKQYDVELNLTTEKMVQYDNIDLMNSYHIGNGVVAELTFQLRIIDYYTEIYDNDVREAKERYLNAKMLYTELMKIYNIIAKAQLNMDINRTFIKLYQKLIYGNKNENDFLETEDKNMISRTLDQVLSKEALKLQSLYEVNIINTAYNKEVLDLLLEYKNKQPVNKDILEAFDNAEIYYYIEELFTDTLDGYEVLDSRDFYSTDEDKKFYIIDDASIDDNTPEEDILVYKYKYTTGDIYFYKVNKTEYINDEYFNEHSTDKEEDLVVFYDVSKHNFKVVKKEAVLADGCELYVLQRQSDAAYITYLELLNNNELAALKIEDYYLNAHLTGVDKIIGYCSEEEFNSFKNDYLKTTSNQYDENEYYIFSSINNDKHYLGEEIYFTSQIIDLLHSTSSEQYNIPVFLRNKLLYEETEINQVLNDVTIEGVNNKHQNLSQELDNINKDINDMQTQVDNLELTYINAYINMDTAIESYNTAVYQDWCARALDELFNKNSDYYPALQNGKTTFNSISTYQTQSGAIRHAFIGYGDDNILLYMSSNVTAYPNSIIYQTTNSNTKLYGKDKKILDDISLTATDTKTHPIYVIQYYDKIDNNYYATTDTSFVRNKQYYTFFNNLDYLKAWYQTNSESTYLIIKLKNAFQNGENESAIQISERGEELKDIAFAANELYESISGNLPKVQTYQQMIVDNNNDFHLDNYLEEQIAIQTGQIVLEFYALREAIDIIITALRDENDNITSILKENEWETMVNDCLKLIDKYNFIYSQIVDIDSRKFNFINETVSGFSDVSNFIIYLRTQYQELYAQQVVNSIQDENNVFEMLDIARLSNLENDEKYLSINIDKEYDDISFKYRVYNSSNILDSDKILYGLAARAANVNDTVLPLRKVSNSKRYDPMILGPQYNIFNSTVKGWSTSDRSLFISPGFKNISTYFYREKFPLVYPEGTETIPLSQFILNPLSSTCLDEQLRGSFANNRAYFDSLSIAQKNNVLNLHNKIASNMINMLVTLGGTTWEGWRSSLRDKNYIRDPATRDGLYTVLAIITGLLQDDYITSDGQILHDLIENARQFLITYYGADTQELETIAPLCIRDVPEFSISLDQPISSEYKIPYVNGNPVLVTTGESEADYYYYKKVNLTENWYQPVLLNDELLDQITRVIINEDKDSGTLVEKGLYWEYLKTYLKKIEEKNELREEGENLLRLYQKQLDVYLNKYEQYNQEFEMNQEVYSSYFGTEAYYYYNLLNSDASEETKNNAIQSKRAAAQEAWWKFINLLDARYTQEKERGMYV